MDMQVPLDVLAGVLGRVASVGRAEVDRYANWARGMSQQMSRWAQTAASGATCGCRLVTPQGLALCRSPAVAPCCVCGQTCCLEHVFVGHQQAVCAACVATARAVQRKPAAPAAEAEPPLTRAAALKTLGLKDGADQQAIKDRYRQLAKRHHPDRAKHEADRAKRENRMKAINRAFQFLSEAPRQQAA